jgi:hypothetical protein
MDSRFGIPQQLMDAFSRLETPFYISRIGLICPKFSPWFID